MSGQIFITGVRKCGNMIRQKNVRQKNKDYAVKVFIFLSHIFLSGLLDLFDNKDD
jgi:hypothetical protein